MIKATFRSARQLLLEFPVSGFVLLSCLFTWLFALPGYLGLGLSQHWSYSGQWHPLGAMGPLLGVAIVVLAIEGRASLKQLMLRACHWRAEPHWAVFAIISPLAIVGAAVVLARLLGHDPAELRSLDFGNQPWLYWLLVTTLPALLYAFSEEIGWRGFALERLQRHFSAFTATAFVAGLWSFWNLPFLLLQTQSSPAQIAGLLSSLFAESIFLTYLYNNSRSGLFLAIIWHMIWTLLALLVALHSIVVANLMNAVLMLVATGLLFILDPSPQQARENA